MEVCSFHFRNPFWTSSSVMSFWIGVMSLMVSGMANSERNVLRIWSSVVQWDGTLPWRRFLAAGDKLEKVRAS